MEKIPGSSPGSGAMDIKLEEALYDDFPLLYRNRLHWGFECGDGWEPLIRRLSEKLEAHIADTFDESRECLSASQVKEKFGTLRFYMCSTNDDIEKLIGEAEDESSVTCETCGAPGIRRGTAWLYTSCDEHARV